MNKLTSSILVEFSGVSGEVLTKRGFPTRTDVIIELKAA
jgi:hypothetical protein